MGAIKDAEDECVKYGSRLYHLRATSSIHYFKNSEKYHMGELGLFPYAPTKGHIALGMKYARKSTTMIEDDYELYYR